MNTYLSKYMGCYSVRYTMQDAVNLCGESLNFHVSITTAVDVNIGLHDQLKCYTANKETVDIDYH